MINHESNATPHPKADSPDTIFSDETQATKDNKKAYIRVRMYRVGFGDFFLLTVPGNNGPAHILIDCGVHAGNIGSMDACVQNLKKETNNKLALVILTHAHADHMSGFATNYDDFANFDVGAVWITNRLDPADPEGSKFMAQLTSVASQLQLRLGSRDDESAKQAHHKVENALGVNGSNAKALQLLQSGIKCKPPVRYYEAEDTPTLPAELEGRITAKILGPSPKKWRGIYAASDNKTEQYLAAVADNGNLNAQRVQPFEKSWPGSAADYPDETFGEFNEEFEKGASDMETILAAMQPDMLAEAANKLDGTLNNQSLVILFTCHEKNLLFVGDAQWGNWSYWLYGKAVAGADPGISEPARKILGSIDFYKVGHHGSTNATPKPVVHALNKNCASMCSTAIGAYGNPDQGTEVPRTKLLEELQTQTGNRLVRSDWVAAAGKPPAEVHKFPDDHGFTSPPDGLYIDYTLDL